MYEYSAIITNVVDGDTFDLDIDLGFRIRIHERVRLLGIDCPEKTARNGEEEKKAGKYITDWAKRELEGKEVKIRSRKGTDSFGRWLVDMEVDWGNGPVNMIFVYNGLGFNKLSSGYSLDRILKKIDLGEKVENEMDFDEPWLHMNLKELEEAARKFAEHPEVYAIDVEELERALFEDFNNVE